MIVLATIATPAAVTAQNSAPAPPAEKAAAPSQAGQPAKPPSPWLLAPVVSSNPKLGTAFGALGAYLKKFDADSQVSLFGLNLQYTTTDSKIAAAFARTSFGHDHHRLVAITVFGYIKNDYEDYLGTGEPLKTNDDLQAVSGRYLYRIKGNWFIGAQGTLTNYQVLGETAQDDLMLDTLGVQGFDSTGLGAVAMHDSRDNPDMPREGWYVNVNNLAYLESGETASFDAYRADLRAFWLHGGTHVLGLRQFNWLTHDAPPNGQATVTLRGYKPGQYLAPYSSSIELEERFGFNARWGATVFAGAAVLYGESASATTERDVFPVWGAGLHFVIKPAQRMLMNLEYADGVDDNRGAYLKFGYAW